MNQKLLKLQLIGCGILSLVLLAEWGYGQFAGKQLQTLLDQEAASDFQPENLPELSTNSSSTEQYAAVVERPLFIEGRKPIVEEAPKEVQAVEVGQIDDWQLIGVYTKSAKPMVLFRNQKEAKKYLKLNEQQNISGWTVLKIQPDQVTLQQGSQQKAVPLRKPRAQSPAANAKSPTPVKPNRPGAPVNAAPPPVPANNNPLETSNDDSE